MEIKTVEDYCNVLSELLPECPVCHRHYKPLLVLKDNESSEILGIKLLCDCNTKDVMTPEDMCALPMLSNDEILDMIKRNQNGSN